MNEIFSKLSLNDLVDKLSECTAKYSKSPWDGANQEQFSELKTIIEELQKEIRKRRNVKSET
jgi:hypothetical protein